MIYELRTYTVKPGTLGDIVKAASTVSRDVRGDNYGKLEGYWFTEIGPLNQVMHMWSYESFDERARLRGELAKNPRWNNEYIPLIRPIVVRQDIRLLNAISSPVAPATSGNIYEFRNYRALVGREVIGAQPVLSHDDRIVGDGADLLDEPGEMERDLRVRGHVTDIGGCDR